MDRIPLPGKPTGVACSNETGAYAEFFFHFNDVAVVCFLVDNIT